MSKKALPTKVMTRGCEVLNFLPDLTRNGHVPAFGQIQFGEADTIAASPALARLPERWLSLLIRRCEVVSKAIYFVRPLLF